MPDLVLSGPAVTFRSSRNRRQRDVTVNQAVMSWVGGTPCGGCALQLSPLPRITVVSSTPDASSCNCCLTGMLEYHGSWPFAAWSGSGLGLSKRTKMGFSRFPFESLGKAGLADTRCNDHGRAAARSRGDGACVDGRSSDRWEKRVAIGWRMAVRPLAASRASRKSIRGTLIRACPSADRLTTAS